MIGTIILILVGLLLFKLAGGLGTLFVYSCARKPRFQNAGNRHSRNGKPLILLN